MTAQLEAGSSRAVKIRMMVSADGIDGVGRGSFKLCAKPLRLKKSLYYIHLSKLPSTRGRSPAAFKICTRSFVVRRTIIEQLAQKLSGDINRRNRNGEKPLRGSAFASATGRIDQGISIEPPSGGSTNTIRRSVQ
jgi:hypothetical protein